MASSSVVVLMLMLIVSSFLVRAYTSGHGPADNLVALVNAERESKKLPALMETKLLSCLAGTYADSFQGNCKKDNIPQAKKIDFISKSKCNADDVESVDSITLCRPKYDTPANIIKNLGNSSILYSTRHKEVGDVITGTGGGGPYFWCLLFDASNSTNLVVGSLPPGCYVGTGLGCGDAPTSIGHSRLSYVISSLVFVILLL